MKNIKILLVEDNEDDAILEMNILQDGGYEVEYKRVETLNAVSKEMKNSEWDCIITDYALGEFNGLDVLDVYKKNELDIPFIMVSGTVGEEVAVKAMKAGIHDYIMKDNPSRFLPALERELNEAKNRKIKKNFEADLYIKEVRFQALIEQAADAFYMHDFKGIIIDVNRRACECLGYSRAELVGMNVLQIDQHLNLEKSREIWDKTLEGEAYTHYSYHYQKIGTRFPVEVRIGSCKINNEHFIVALVRDITDIKQAESRILQLNRLYSTLSYINQTIVKVREKIPLFQEICKVVVEHGGFRMAWIGLYDEEKRTVTPTTYAGHESGYLKQYNLLDLEKEAKNGPIAISIREGHSIICQNIETDNRVLPWRDDALKRGYKSVSTIPLRCNDKIIGVLLVYSSEANIFGEEYEKLLDEIGEDISFALDSIRREEEFKAEMQLKKGREEQQRRFQKMEALGQLSGGIAHDFNNVLGIIVGSLEIAEMNLQEGNINLAIERIEKTVNTALRGSEITQKLLSFSRKTNDGSEVFNPKIILENLNEILIRLLVDQELVLEINKNSSLIKCNPTDFENAILNLCINARDAVKQHGKIHIKLLSEFISDQDVFKYNLPIKSGDYVKISVQDNGIGISEENIQKVFIPFFTTKPDGKGTGLGLPNVYSFVEQSNGGIRIDSEVGKGTEVTLVFPLAGVLEEQEFEANSVKALPKNNSKKILVVDDEESLLDLIEAILTFSGYMVLRATNSNQALKILLEEKDIDLLFTDVLLPGSIGTNKLVENALNDFPDIKILLTSGFPKDLQKIKGQKFPILQKPYRTDELIKQVERLFDT